jgi:GTP-binding protein
MSHPREVRFIGAAARPEHYPPERLPEVAFVGRSNVGKSSVINALVGRRGLARTSQTPGKTQLIHFYQVEDRFVLVDLPGYGYARVPEAVRRRWRPMIERYLGGRRSLCLVVALMDIRRTPGEDERRLGAWLAQQGLETRFVVTKADKVSRGRWLSALGRTAASLGVDGAGLILFSSVTHEGKKALWEEILRAVGGR